jgi:hypothetical protein
MADVTQTYGGYTALTLTSLASLASSATAGWISDIIDNRTTAALDYEFLFTFPMANTAAANDKAVYVFAVPAVHNGSAWVLADGGTATLPTAGPATYTFAGITTTNNFRPLATLSYTTADQVVQGMAMLSDAFGRSMPDGVALFVLNYSGAAFDGSGQAIGYKALANAIA